MGQWVSANVHHPEVRAIRRSEYRSDGRDTGAIVVEMGQDAFSNAVTLFFHEDEQFNQFIAALEAFRGSEQ